MAMRPSQTAPTEMLDRKYSNTAAVTSIALSLLAAGMLVARMIFGERMPALATAYLTTWVVLLGIVIAAGVSLLRGQIWAQRFSLIYYVVVAGGALVASAAALMPGGATWWQESVHAAVVLVVALAGAGGAAVLLVLASAPASRLRYASVVAVTIAAAVTLVVVVNLVGHMVARSRFLPLSLETSGLYGLSQRTRRIVGALSTPVRLTCAYTSADEEGKKISSKYGPRTLEILEDMAGLSDKIEVVNANTDAAKARVIARLRGQLGGKADKHIKFLEQFAADSDLTAKSLAEQAEQWRPISTKTAYLDLWGMSVEIARVLDRLGANTEKARNKVKAELGGSGLVDYAKLADDAEKSVKDTQKALKQVAQLLAQIAEIPIKVTENRQDALKKTAKCVDSVSAMARAIGTPEKPRPSNPSSVLGRFITAARETAHRARIAAKALADIGGPKNANLVGTSRVWQTRLPGGPGIALRASFHDLYGLLAQRIDQMVLDSEGLIKAAKADYQADIIVKMRPQVVALATSFNNTHEKVSAATTSLVTVDEQTRKIFNQADNKSLFKDLLARCGNLLAQADKLPELKSSSLTTDITGDNIVIVEAGGKTKVVEFDTVWPLRSGPMGPARPADTEQRRIFDGNTAINSKILSLTSTKPFATVLLAYYRPAMPPRMRQMIPPAEIEPAQLNTLKKRLEEANFVVKDWNLGQDMPEPEPDEPATQVLIVLPPPPAMAGPMARAGMGQFGPEHVNKIREAVDSGIHAIFLALFIQPRRMSMFGPVMQPPYGLNGYLREDWGIEALTDHLVVPAVADDNDPGKFKISGHRLSYLPLNNFGNNAIGKPLRRQRVLWASLCPIRTDPRLPEGVTVQPLLSIPGDWRDTWATRRFRELVEQFRSGAGSKVYPNYAKGDLAAPFDVAVAATRASSTPAQTQPTTTQAATAPDQQRVKSARIVVLGMGQSLTDGYLTQPVPVQDAKGTVTLVDPPRANADVVINSVYWLTGRENYIAAGPAGAQLVLIGKVARTVLATIFVVVLPALVLAAGAMVMVMRRR